MFNLDHIKVRPFDERTAPSGRPAITQLGPMSRAERTAADLAVAATRVLLALNHECPDQRAYDRELQDAESSLCAQLAAEEYVPSSWTMYVEHDQMPETENLVSVHCAPPGRNGEPGVVWLQVNATTGAVARY